MSTTQSRKRTARDPRHDILFEPVTIGPKVAKNRFYQVPHCTGFGSRKPDTQAAFRGMRAEGGWGVVNVEWVSFALDADQTPWVPAHFIDEQDAVNLRGMVDSAHEHNALVGIELTHVGVYAENRESRWHTIGPSQLSTDLGLPTCVPKTMEKSDIRRVQDDWVKAARRARDLGFDIVYVYGGDSFLPIQFLSEHHNKRQDEYSGSFENRARFWMETLEEVRFAVGDDCAIAVRISLDGLGEGGLELAEGVRFVEYADHLVDLWDLKISSLRNGYKDVASSRFFKTGHQLEWVRHARGATSKPIVGVGRYTDPTLMAETIRSGELDMIGAARPSIADPFLPTKIEEGRYDEIRECIGCNVCLWGAQDHLHLSCTQNATAGEEYRRGWHPERFDRAGNADSDVLVLGSGPAGLEAAIVLGKRGMRRVHIVEADADIGGCMRWIPRLPGFGEWARALDWRRIQIDRLRNVELITNQRLDAAAVREYGADIVICATGSRWATNGLNGLSGLNRAGIPGADASSERIITPEQLMLEGKRPLGENVIVYDAEGYFMGSSLAELLALEGYSVELITPLEKVSPVLDLSREGKLQRPRLHELGVRRTTSTTIVRIDGGKISTVGEFAQPLPEAEADCVVLVTQRLSCATVYDELVADEEANRREGISAVLRVGDCVSPRRIADAIFDGHRIGREIDSDNPALPLSHLRERATPATAAAI